MIGQYQNFMDYVTMDLFDWKIKEDAPKWAKKEFEEYINFKENIFNEDYKE